MLVFEQAKRDSKKGQLSGHLQAGVTVESSIISRRESNQYSNLNWLRANETAERALTDCSSRAFSRKVRSQVSNRFKVQHEGQLSGHLHAGVVGNSTKERSQISDKYKAEDKGQLSGHLRAEVVESPSKVNEVRFWTGTECKIGTAERALTSWSRRAFSRKVRSQVSNKLELQHERQLSGHLHPGVIKNQPNERIKNVRER